ncbi:hypothetical protein D9M72_441830 [compost metagenome]
MQLLAARQVHPAPDDFPYIFVLKAHPAPARLTHLQIPGFFEIGNHCRVQDVKEDEQGNPPDQGQPLQALPDLRGLPCQPGPDQVNQGVGFCEVDPPSQRPDLSGQMEVTGTKLFNDDSLEDQRIPAARCVQRTGRGGSYGAPEDSGKQFAHFRPGEYFEPDFLK